MAPAAAGGLEVGAGSFLLSGGAAGGYLGATAFLMTESNRGVFLRPSLLFGASTGTTARSSLGGARLDACARIDGNYSTGGGLQLDLCGGVDGGWAVVDAGTQAGQPLANVWLPYLDLGPSVDLRAELGRLAVTVRVVAGVDLTAGSYVDVTGTREQVPMWPVRFELALSWDAGGQELVTPTEYEAKRR